MSRDSNAPPDLPESLSKGTGKSKTEQEWATPEEMQRFNSSTENYDESSQCEDFEEILEMVGSEGRYQKMILYGVLCPLMIMSPFPAHKSLFMLDIPDHNCHVPGRDPGVSLEQWRNLTIPSEVGPDGLLRPSQCKMIDQITGNETDCQFGWEFDKQDYDTTIPTTYNWVCDKERYVTDSYAWSGFGGAFGSIFFGILGDKYGRKPIFFIACFISVATSTLGLYWADNFLVYNLIGIVGSVSGLPIFNLPVLFCAEVSSLNYRSWIYAVTWMIVVVGNTLLPFVAMYVRDWFILGWIGSVVGLMHFLLYPLIDESPRWLITVGEPDQATKIILKMAKINGKTVDPDRIDAMVKSLTVKQKNEEEGQSVNFWMLFSTWNIAKNTFNVTMVCTLTAMLFGGVTLNTTRMAGNKFLNYAYLALIELPGGWLGGILVEKAGRRWTQTALYLMCALCCLLCAWAVAQQYTEVVIIGAIGIKFSVIIVEMIGCLQGSEIFPTLLRSTGNGLADTVAAMVGILGPYIVFSGTVHVSYPYLLFCVLSLLGMVSAACIPETYKQKLPETVEDANNFGKNHKFWSYLPTTPAVEKTGSVKMKNVPESDI